MITIIKHIILNISHTSPLNVSKNIWNTLKSNRYWARYYNFNFNADALVIIANLFFVYFVRVICPEITPFHELSFFNTHNNSSTGTPVAGSWQHCSKAACKGQIVKITKRFLQITIQQRCLIKIFIYILLKSAKMFTHKLVGARRFLSARLAVIISNYLVQCNPMKFLKLLTHVRRDIVTSVRRCGQFAI